MLDPNKCVNPSRDTKTGETIPRDASDSHVEKDPLHKVNDNKNVYDTEDTLSEENECMDVQEKVFVDGKVMGGDDETNNDKRDNKEDACHEADDIQMLSYQEHLGNIHQKYSDNDYSPDNDNVSSGLEMKDEMDVDALETETEDHYDKMIRT